MCTPFDEDGVVTPWIASFQKKIWTNNCGRFMLVQASPGATFSGCFFSLLMGLAWASDWCFCQQRCLLSWNLVVGQLMGAPPIKPLIAIRCISVHTNRRHQRVPTSTLEGRNPPALHGDK